VVDNDRNCPVILVVLVDPAGRMTQVVHQIQARRGRQDFPVDQRDQLDHRHLVDRVVLAVPVVRVDRLDRAVHHL